MSRKMKGQEWTIEAMLKVVLVLVVFAGSLMIMIAVAGGLNEVLQMFCRLNPSWCGEMEACVCCETVIHKQMGWPFDDIYSREYIWTNEEDCIELIKENDGAMWWKENDPNLAKCGTIPNATLTSGLIFKDTCAIPERYVSDQLLPCICCQSEPQAGLYTWEWDMSWRCMERNNYNITDNDACGPMWLMPPEAQKKTLQRIGKFFGIGGEYCAIPYPYNLTVQP